MSNPKWDEQIIVVRRSWLFGHNDAIAFQGVVTEPERVALYMQHIDEGIEIMRRGDKHDPTPAHSNAEINKAYKQPIPYIVLRRGEEYFAYRRLEGGTESGLHGKVSIGVGGHMNAEEGRTFAQVLDINLHRELNEELIIPDVPIEPQAIGLINDDSDPTSIVHIAIVFIVDLPEGTEIGIREKDTLSGGWYTLDQLAHPLRYDKLESWSQIAVDTLKGRGGK